MGEEDKEIRNSKGEGRPPAAGQDDGGTVLWSISGAAIREFQ
jgi:hypothetical protein